MGCSVRMSNQIPTTVKSSEPDHSSADNSSVLGVSPYASLWEAWLRPDTLDPMAQMSSPHSPTIQPLHTLTNNHQQANMKVSTIIASAAVTKRYVTLPHFTPIMLLTCHATVPLSMAS